MTNADEKVKSEKKRKDLESQRRRYLITTDRKKIDDLLRRCNAQSQSEKGESATYLGSLINKYQLQNVTY